MVMDERRGKMGFYNTVDCNNLTEDYAIWRGEE